jgi:hypothetical protein
MVEVEEHALVGDRGLKVFGLVRERGQPSARWRRFARSSRRRPDPLRDWNLIAPMTQAGLLQQT